MRWTRPTLAIMVLLGLTLAACSDIAETPTAPVSQDASADKRGGTLPDVPNLAIDQDFLADIYASYEGISEWDCRTLKEWQDFIDHYAHVPVGWDEAEPVIAALNGGGDRAAVEDEITICFPVGTEPFAHNAIFFEVTGRPVDWELDFNMIPDPQRYGLDVIGDNYVSFRLVDHVPGTLYEYQLFHHDIPDFSPDSDGPLHMNLPFDGSKPDREANVIIPGGSPPPEDGDD